jgi:hypothetical protein
MYTFFPKWKYIFFRYYCCWVYLYKCKCQNSFVPFTLTFSMVSLLSLPLSPLEMFQHPCVWLVWILMWRSQALSFSVTWYFPFALFIFLYDFPPLWFTKLHIYVLFPPFWQLMIPQSAHTFHSLLSHALMIPQSAHTFHSLLSHALIIPQSAHTFHSLLSHALNSFVECYFLFCHTLCCLCLN